MFLCISFCKTRVQNSKSNHFILFYSNHIKNLHEHQFFLSITFYLLMLKYLIWVFVKVDAQSRNDFLIFSRRVKPVSIILLYGFFWNNRQYWWLIVTIVSQWQECSPNSWTYNIYLNIYFRDWCSIINFDHQIILSIKKISDAQNQTDIDAPNILMLNLTRIDHHSVIWCSK